MFFKTKIGLQDLLKKLAEEVKLLGITIHTHRNGDVSFKAFGNKDRIELFQDRLYITNQQKNYVVLHEKKSEKVVKEELELGFKTNTSFEIKKKETNKGKKFPFSDSQAANIKSNIFGNFKMFQQKREKNIAQEILKEQIKDVHNIFLLIFSFLASSVESRKGEISAPAESRKAPAESRKGEPPERRKGDYASKCI